MGTSEGGFCTDIGVEEVVKADLPTIQTAREMQIHLENAYKFMLFVYLRSMCRRVVRVYAYLTNDSIRPQFLLPNFGRCLTVEELQIPFFDGLDASARDLVVQFSTSINYEDCLAISREDDPGRGLFINVSGRL